MSLPREDPRSGGVDILSAAPTPEVEGALVESVSSLVDLEERGD